MDILNISLPQGQMFTGAQAPAQSSAPKAQAPAPAPVVKTEVPETAEKAQYEAVVRAAEAVKANYFVVSDVRFTIFKDLAGDYVTRFTSLKDGSVKYFPQKTLFEEFQIRMAEHAAMVDTQA